MINSFQPLSSHQGLIISGSSQGPVSQSSFHNITVFLDLFLTKAVTLGRPPQIGHIDYNRHPIKKTMQQNDLTTKILITLLISTTVLCNLTSEDTDNSEYKSWKAKHGLTYGNEAEDRYREFLYGKTAQNIKAHNQGNAHTYKKAHNKFSAETQEQLKQKYLGATPPKVSHDVNNEKRVGRARNNVNSNDLQVKNTDPNADASKDKDAEFIFCFPFCTPFIKSSPKNWTAEGKVTPVKDQGNCGSCWAFSGVAAIESSYLIEKDQELDLSQQQVLDCSVGYDGCLGGWMTYVFDDAIAFGLEEEKNYPYQGKQSATCKKDRGEFKIESYETTLTCQNIVDYVVEEGPVSVGVFTDANWFSYSEGVFACAPIANPFEANHGVVITGVTAEGNFIIKNSWGIGWGELGYMTLDMKSNCNICNIGAYLPEI